MRSVSAINEQVEGLLEVLLAEADPSLGPPKRWFAKMSKKIKAGNPGYDDERIAATVGSIWYHKLPVKRRKEIRRREGKRYGKAA